jgi:hypothetical protein
MHLGQTFHLVAAQDPAPHSAGWLRWFILGAVAIVVFMAWFCLHGYNSGSDED